MAEAVNTPDVARYLVTVYPLTEHEVKQQLKEAVKSEHEKHIVAELDGEPVGYVGLHLGRGRTRHVGWLGLWVRRNFWGRKIGTALMEELIRIAKAYGCRKLMLEVFEGNGKALKLLGKWGFKLESKTPELAYIEGKWRTGITMGLELVSLEPKISVPSRKTNTEEQWRRLSQVKVRQLMDADLDEVNRLQNCVDSAKSSKRIPPVSKEKTKEWYETLDTHKGKFCLGCFKNKGLLGYIRFNVIPPPFIYISIEEFLVDVTCNPEIASDLLIKALVEFKKRYLYRKIICEIPVISSTLTKALEENGFVKTGIWNGYYFIDGYYVNAVSYVHSGLSLKTLP